MAHFESSEAFVKNDYVYVESGGRHYYGTVFRQDHQWLFTSAGVFNIAHPDVKILRKVSDVPAMTPQS